MPPDRWERVQSVFLSLADLPPGERAVLLDKECGGDDELRAEVESLLASDRESSCGPFRLTRSLVRPRSDRPQQAQ
jgi:hypothetical protein